MQVVVRDFFAVAKQHLLDEERVLQQAAYPGLLRHRRRHAELVLELGGAYMRYLNGELKGSTLAHLLRRVLTRHFGVEDQEWVVDLARRREAATA